MDLMNLDECPSIAQKVNFLSITQKVNFLSIIWIHYQTFLEGCYMKLMFSQTYLLFL